MPVPVAIDEHSSYPARLFALVSLSLSQLVRPPSHARRAEAARKLARHIRLLDFEGAEGRARRRVSRARRVRAAARCDG